MFGCGDITNLDNTNVKNFKNYTLKVESIFTNSKCETVHLNRGIKLFNITGKLTTNAKNESFIYLSKINENSTFDEVINEIENCRPFWRSKIINQTNFEFNNIIPGRYVIFLPSNSFIVGQGFPSPNEFIIEGYELKSKYYGGDPEISISVFEITQSQ